MTRVQVESWAITFLIGIFLIDAALLGMALVFGLYRIR